MIPIYDGETAAELAARVNIPLAEAQVAVLLPERIIPRPAPKATKPKKAKDA